MICRRQASLSRVKAITVPVSSTIPVNIPALEFHPKDGGFAGYSKPLILDLKVDKSGSANPSVGRKIWAKLAAAVGSTLKNKKKDQIATKVPIQGRFDDPKAGIWTSIAGLLKNAFISALKPSFDLPPVKLKDAKKASKKK